MVGVTKIALWIGTVGSIMACISWFLFHSVILLDANEILLLSYLQLFYFISLLFQTFGVYAFMELKSESHGRLMISCYCSFPVVLCFFFAFNWISLSSPALAFVVNYFVTFIYFLLEGRIFFDKRSSAAKPKLATFVGVELMLYALYSISLAYFVLLISPGQYLALYLLFPAFLMGQTGYLFYTEIMGLRKDDDTELEPIEKDPYHGELQVYDDESQDEGDIGFEGVEND